jgi:sugar lactone lactonase YvrE
MIRYLLLLATVSAFLISTPRPAVEAIDDATYPIVMSVPDGWQPESLAAGRGSEVLVGSRRHGGIYALNVETGEGRVLFAGQQGRTTNGVAFDPRSNYVYAAGAATGELNVYDAFTGATVATYKLGTGSAPTQVNDVIVTRDAAYASDSQRPVIYRVPLDEDGNVPPATNFEVINLGGDYVHATGINGNGIDATPDGTRVILMKTNTGQVFDVNPNTGHATLIDLGGATLPSGDGILLEGDKLYVVRNQANIVVKIDLSADFKQGRIVDQYSHQAMDQSTGIAKIGTRIYAVNARFAAGAATTVNYQVVALQTGDSDE